MAKEKSILTSHQIDILEAIASEDYFTKRFYLAGGTALAEFYLQHRLSKNLDFFTSQKEVNPIPIVRFFEDRQKKLKIKKIATSRVFGLYTFFLHFQDGENLKVDFNYYPFPLTEKGATFKKLEVESVYDIAVDKVHTVVMKPRARDYIIDIYFIIKECGYDLGELVKQAKIKFDWHITAVELGTRLIEATEATDFPRMIKKIDHAEWKQFFVKEAAKLKKEIFK